MQGQRESMSSPLMKAKIFDSQGTRVLQLGKATVTIGSAANCDIVLTHDSVHQEHARVWLDAGKVWVQDLGGEYQSFLNDIPLPKMKPMLVRQLDVLRFGSCEATVGLEPILVRAPVINIGPTKNSVEVKPAVPSQPLTSARPPIPVVQDSVPPTPPEPAVSAKPVESVKSAEVESIARVLADVRLQLQMAKLEVKSTKELSNQVQILTDELKAARELNQKFSDASKQIDAELERTRRNQEDEISGLLARIQREKCEAHEAFARRLRDTSSELVKRWSGRSMSTDLVTEWEAETLRNFRHVVMHGLDHVPALPKLPALPNIPEVVVRTLPRSGEEGAAKVVVEKEVDEAEEPATKKRALPLKKILLTAAGVAAILTALWFGVNWFKEAGFANQSSHAIDSGTSEKRTAPVRFEPKKSRTYRNSYVDNVLYFENFVGAEQNPDFRKLWIIELTKTAKFDWKVEEAMVLPIATKEEVLVQDLSRIASGITVDREQAGIGQMQARESQFRKELEDIFKSKAGVDRYLQFKRSFYARYQAYLHKGSN